LTDKLSVEAFYKFLPIDFYTDETSEKIQGTPTALGKSSLIYKPGPDPEFVKSRPSDA
jgi:hypothetical protein